MKSLFIITPLTAAISIIAWDVKGINTLIKEGENGIWKKHNSCDAICIKHTKHKDRDGLWVKEKSSIWHFSGDCSQGN